MPTFENKRVGRLILNSFFLRATDDILWLGRNSDDFITVITEQQKGKAWVKFAPIQATYDVWTPKTKKHESGGSVQLYNELGAYRLRFYGVIFHPDCFKIKIDKNNCDGSAKQINAYPYIVSEKVKK